MKNGYELLSLLQSKLNQNNTLMTSILEHSKEEFSNNESMIMTAVGILNEIKEIAYSLDEGVFILNKSLYNVLTPIAKYAENMFNQYKLVNAYKLYDVIKFDIFNLKEFLDRIKR